MSVRGLQDAGFRPGLLAWVRQREPVLLDRLRLEIAIEPTAFLHRFVWAPLNPASRQLLVAGPLPLAAPHLWKAAESSQGTRLLPPADGFQKATALWTLLMCLRRTEILFLLRWLGAALLRQRIVEDVSNHSVRRWRRWLGPRTYLDVLRHGASIGAGPSRAWLQAAQLHAPGGRRLMDISRALGLEAAGASGHASAAGTWLAGRLQAACGPHSLRLSLPAGFALEPAALEGALLDFVVRAGYAER